MTNVRTGISTARLFAPGTTDQKLEDILLGQLVRDGRIFTQPIKMKDEKVYFFNKDWVYTSCSKEDRRFKGRRVLFTPTDVSELFDFSIWGRAKNQFKINMSLPECLRLYLNTQIVLQRPDGPIVDRLVTKIEYPFVVNDENYSTEKKVIVTVNLSRYLYPTFTALSNAVKEHKKEINQKVKQTLLASKDTIERQGIDFNHLHINDILINRDCTLDYIFVMT